MTLDRLIEGYLEGTADRTDLAALSRALEKDDAAAMRLARHVLLRQHLEDHFGRPPAPYILPELPDPSADIPPTGWPDRTVWWLGGLVVFGLVTAAVFFWTGGERPPVDAVAVVAAASDDLQWDTAARAPAGPGSSLPRGRVTVRAGCVSLLFTSGARLKVEGPAELDIQDEMHVLMKSGQVRAEVPEQARGFAVEMPGLKVVDLGTEFGVRLPPGGQPEVSVYRGEVEATLTRQGSSYRMNDWESRRFDVVKGTGESMGVAVAPPSVDRPSQAAPDDHPLHFTPPYKAGTKPAGAWVSAGNWTPSRVPGPRDAALVAGNALSRVTGGQSVRGLTLGGATGGGALVIESNGGLNLERMSVDGAGRIDVRGGMLTFESDMVDPLKAVNLCTAPESSVEINVDGGFFVVNRSARLAFHPTARAKMTVSGGIVDLNAPMVICQAGQAELLQTGGQIDAGMNLFVTASKPDLPVRYTIRGGRLTGAGTLRLADKPIGEATFRVEGSRPEITIDRLAMATDHGVLEFVLDENGVSPVRLSRWADLRDMGTLRVIAPDGVARVSTSLTLIRNAGVRYGRFGRLELVGLAGDLVYDDQSGEVRLEDVRRTGETDDAAP